MTATSHVPVVSRRPREAVKALQRQVNTLLGEIELIHALPATLHFLKVSRRENEEQAPLLEVEACTEEVLKLLPPVQIQSLPEGVCFRGISRNEFPRSSADTVIFDVLRDGKGCRWFARCGGILFEVQSKSTSMVFGEYDSVPFGPRGVQLLRKQLVATVQVAMEIAEPQVAFKSAQSAMANSLAEQFVDVEPASLQQAFGVLSNAFYTQGGLPPHVMERVKGLAWPSGRLEQLVSLVRTLPAYARNAQLTYVQNVLEQAGKWTEKFFRGPASRQVNVLDPRTLTRLASAHVHSELEVEVVSSSHRPRKGAYDYKLALRFRGIVKVLSVSCKHSQDAQEPAFDWYGGGTVLATAAP